MKNWISIKLYELGYWLCGIALKMRGIDRKDFDLHWAKKLVSAAEMTSPKQRPREWTAEINEIYEDGSSAGYLFNGSIEEEIGTPRDSFKVVEHSAYAALERENELLKQAARPYVNERCAKLAEENERLKKDLTKEEAFHLATIDQRDSHEDYLNRIADTLGDNSEWSNINHRGDRALEWIETLRAELETAIESLESISYMIGESHPATGTEIDDYIKKALAKLKADGGGE